MTEKEASARPEPGPSGHFYVVGGEQRKEAFRTEEWHAFGKALIFEVAVATGEVREVVSHISPPEVVTSDGLPSITFKAGTRHGDHLYACTQTEVLVYHLPDFARVRTLSLPCFNDVHHVRRRDNGNLLVVSTGLDMVTEIDPADRVLRRWNVLGGDPWGRFDPTVDYRRVATTKPHGAHPNYVLEVGGEIWVTRFEQRDVVCLTAPGRRVEIGVERPHDGIVLGEKTYFTTVDGRVAIADLDRDRLLDVIDLHAIAGGAHALGWCRGLTVLDEARVVVGFSRLRPTRFRENVRWVKHRLGLRATPGDRPSRIACFDLAARRLLWQQSLEEVGLNVIFSVHPAPGPDPAGRGS